jgi:5-methylcytosine-specific restriction enzyme A
MTRRKSFTDAQRLKVYHGADGICHLCGRKIEPGEAFHVEHPKALGLGGTNDLSNLLPAHVDCHAGKTRQDVAIMRKADRQGKKHLGLKKSRNPLPGSRGSKFRKRMDGTVEIRK